MKPFLFFLFTIGIAVSGFSQDVLKHRIDGVEKGKPLAIYLHELEKTSGNKFFFLDQWFESLRIEDAYIGLTLEEALEKMLHGTDITYTLFYNYAIVFAKDPNRTLDKLKYLQSIKDDKKRVETKSLGTKEKFKPGTVVSLSGIIKDGKTLDPLEGATVIVEDANKATTSSATGAYSLQIPAGEHFIAFRFGSYEEKIIHLNAYENGEMEVLLSEAPKVLEEVVVTGQQATQVNTNVGQIDLKIKDLKKLPTFMGEVDIVKQIQVLPGVTTVGEISAGFNVRGGGADQNLVLYDGVQVFNNSHVFGFFSAFNSEAIGSASFFKGGIPATYGGRVSSVLTINSKEGDYKKWSASGGIGPISGNLAVNGPIFKDKTSFSASVRSSYSDWLVKKIPYKNVNQSSVWFYDASIKIAHKFSNRDKLSLSAYVSQDNFGLPSDTTFKWHNRLASLEYHHIFNEHLFSMISVGYGEYGYDVVSEKPKTAYDLKYNISYPTFKGDINYHIGKHKFGAGIGSIWYGITPGSIAPTSAQSIVKPFTVSKEQSIENSVFLNDEIELNEYLRVDAGVRVSSFTAFGPSKVYLYKPDQPISNSTIIDSVSYSSGKPVKNYVGFEPRFSAVYKLSPFSSLKFGYNRIFQYLHLISNSVSITPVDIWQPSNQYFKPQQGDQYSLGYFRTLSNGKFDVSAEGFYKAINNILDFKDGSSLILNPNLETALLSGVAKSYGLEVALNKISGRLQGSLNYTYSRSLRKVQSKYQDESLNNGNYYPSNYDQPNVVNLTWKYAVSRRVSFTGNFTYRSGRPVTLPYGFTHVSNIPIVAFSERNSYRLPDYHRLDFALIIEGSHRRKKIFDGSWVISLYNVYARKNVYSVFYKTNENGIQTPYQLSIIGTILPSISYRLKI